MLFLSNCGRDGSNQSLSQSPIIVVHFQPIVNFMIAIKLTIQKMITFYEIYINFRQKNLFFYQKHTNKLCEMHTLFQKAKVSLQKTRKEKQKNKSK